MTDLIPEAAKPPQVPNPGRRTFITKILPTSLLAILLAGCGAKPTQLDPSISSGIPSSEGVWPTRAPEDYIVFHPELKGKEIYQAKITQGKGLIQTIEEASESRWENWNGLSATVILPGNQGIIQFGGVNGGGKYALETFANIAKDNSPVFATVRDFLKSNPQFDLNNLPEGSAVVFGKSYYVDQNFLQISDALQTKFYLEVDSTFTPAGAMGLHQRLNIDSLERTDPNGFRTPLEEDSRRVSIDACRLSDAQQSWRLTPWISTNAAPEGTFN